MAEELTTATYFTKTKAVETIIENRNINPDARCPKCGHPFKSYSADAFTNESAMVTVRHEEVVCRKNMPLIDVALFERAAKVARYK